MFSDSKTVVSDLTDMDISDSGSTCPGGGASFSCETIQKVLLEELNKLAVNDLKERCKECGIAGLSKLKKPELIQLLEVQFNKVAAALDGLSKNDLKQLAKVCNVKRVTGVAKPYLLHHILLFRAGNLMFTEPVLTPEPTKETVVSASVGGGATTNTSMPKEPEKAMESEKVAMTMDAIKPGGVGGGGGGGVGNAASLEELTRQKQMIEEQIATAKEEEERKRRLEEEARAAAAKAEEERERERELKRKQEQEEEERKEREKEQARKKKQTIPKNVRTIVWNHYIGSDIIKHKCLCCKKVAISNTSFEVGHVISEKNGGTHQIDNLRPICFACNHSMGTENMVDFVVKYGLFIG